MTNVDDPDALYHTALSASDDLSGFYNKNVPVQAGSGSVLVRIPLPSGPSMDLRIWRESDVLRIANRWVDGVPKLLHVSSNPAYQVHEFIHGQLLDSVAPRGVSVPRTVVPAVAKLFGQLADVPVDALPEPPAYWPADGDTAGFMGVLVDLTQDVWGRYRTHDRYRRIYDAFDFPNEPLAPLDTRVGAMGKRPFRLLHCDVHRKNMLLVDDSVVFIDWELALWGDPVYDLAVHLHKMDYKASEEGELIRAWRSRLPDSLTDSWESDLPTYLCHERLKSAVVDTVRYSDLIRNDQLPPQQRGARVSQLANKLNAARKIWDMPPIEQATVDQVLAEHGTT